MNYNELTYNELEESELVPHKWCTITKTDTEDEEICFKLKVWALQCKFAKKVLEYIQKLNYGVASQDCLNDLIFTKYMLEVLNSIDVKNLVNETIDYNEIFNKINL